MSTVQAVVFEPLSEANFSGPYTSCGSFPVIDDKIAFEGDETFVVRILDPLAAVQLGSNTTANVTIVDNDGMNILVQ